VTPEGALLALIAEAVGIAASARRLRLRGEADEPRIVALGIATVDTERVERQLRAELGLPHGPSFELPSDLLLGARCRRLPEVESVPMLIQLEPDTEGRLAASLARAGEGPLVAWVATDLADEELRRRAVAAGLVLSRPAGGPLGSERLVLGGPRHGPHLLLLATGATMTA